MVNIVRTGLTLLVGSVLVLSAGCGSGSGNVSPEVGKELAHENTLAELGEMLRLQKGDAPKPPAGTKDLAKYRMGFPGGFERVRNGDIVLLFGAPIEEGASDMILAYEKQTPESGGYVLMQDATTVKKMSAEEFKMARKAPGKAEGKSKA